MLPNPELLLKIGALHSGAFALFHLCFWRLFDWRATLAPLSAVNRGIMQVLNLCLTFGFAGAAVIAWHDRAEIIQTGLGHHLLLGLSLFWALRLVEQLVFFPIRRPLSLLLIALFAFGAVVYALPLVAPAAGRPLSP